MSHEIERLAAEGRVLVVDGTGPTGTPKRGYILRAGDREAREAVLRATGESA